MRTKNPYQFFADLDTAEFSALENDCLERGIMVPVEFDQDGNVLDGHNRLKIAEKHSLPYRRINREFKTEEEKKTHVLMLNMARRHLTPHAWGSAFRMLLDVRGVERKPGPKGNSATVALIAKELGVPERTAKRRLAAADDYEALRDEDRRAVDSGEETLANMAKKAKQERRRKEASNEANLKGKFSVVLADPPWKFGSATATGSAADHYPVMETKAIEELEVRKHVTTNAALFLWSTNAHLPDALRVMSAWGFSYKTCLVWVKDKATTGLGVYLRGKHELLLLGTRGSMIPEMRPVSVIEAPRTEHSRKPDLVYKIIEQMYPGQKSLEMFARKKRKEWESFGNETPQEN